jgi:hypothetical protein
MMTPTSFYIRSCGLKTRNASNSRTAHLGAEEEGREEHC